MMWYKSNLFVFIQRIVPAHINAHSLIEIETKIANACVPRSLLNKNQQPTHPILLQYIILSNHIYGDILVFNRETGFLQSSCCTISVLCSLIHSNQFRLHVWSLHKCTFCYANITPPNQLPAFLLSQNASAGVSRMLLGNKCDIEAKRKVTKETGEKVRWSITITVLKKCNHAVVVSCFIVRTRWDEREKWKREWLFEKGPSVLRMFLMTRFHLL